MKTKSKEATIASPNLDLSGIESAMKEKNSKYNKLIELRRLKKGAWSMKFS